MSLVSESILVSIDAVLVVLIVASSALMLVKLGVVEKKAGTPLSKMTINLFLPCLMLTELIQNLDPSDLIAFLVITLFTIAHILLGSFLGWVSSKLLTSNSGIAKLMMTCPSFHNLSIALIFAQVLGSSNIIQEPDFGEKSVQYVLSCFAINGFAMWSGAFSVMEKDSKKCDSDLSLCMLPTKDRDIKDNYQKSSLILGIKKSLNPPVVATLIGIPLALIPYSREYVFAGENAYLRDNLFASLSMMGKAAPMLITFLIGLKLSDGYSPLADVSWKSIGAIVFLKMFVLPWIGIGLVYLLYTAEVIGRVLAITIVLLWSSPTSLQLFMVCSAQENQEDNIAKVFTIMYLTCPLPLAINTLLSIYLLYI